MHVCISKLSINDADDGLSPGRPTHDMNQCWYNIIWTIRKQFSEISIEMHGFIHENVFENIISLTFNVLNFEISNCATITDVYHVSDFQLTNGNA